MELNEISQNHKDQEQLCSRYSVQEKYSKLLLKIKDNAGIKLLVKELDEMIDSINGTLTFSRDLTDIQREALFTQRDCWEWLKERFISQEHILDKINKYKNTYD